MTTSFNRFTLLSLTTDIVCGAGVPVSGRYRWRITTAKGTTAGLWRSLGLGFDFQQSPDVWVPFRQYFEGSTVEYGGKFYIANNDVSGDPSDTPAVRRDRWTQGQAPGQVPLRDGQIIRVQEQIQVQDPSAVSANLDLDPDADFSRGQIVIEAIDVRYGAPPLATLDGDGI
jgi:hypothetical protein